MSPDFLLWAKIQNIQSRMQDVALVDLVDTHPPVYHEYLRVICCTDAWNILLRADRRNGTARS